MQQVNSVLKNLFPLVFILTIAISCASEGDNGPASQGNSEDRGRTLNYTAEVEFLNSSGDIISTIEVAVADDDATRSEGLMEVYQMPENAGMIFIFEDEQPRSFWMANTPLSLDILFVNANFEIVRIHRNTAPYSQTNILSESPAMYTIEVNAGYTQRHDITEGMNVRLSGL